MKRRDLLQKAGMAALAAPFLATGALFDRSVAQSLSMPLNPLMIVFSGPFAFWINQNSVTVRAPQVGPDDPYNPCDPTSVGVPHQPWAGTAFNETVLPYQNSPSLTLSMNFVSDPQPQPPADPAQMLQYSSQPPVGLPLFSLDVPTPDLMVGTHPTQIFRSSINQITSVAAGAVFIYKNVDLNSLKITGCNPDFLPDFRIDIAASFPCALLGVHLTPLFRSDNDHMHATVVVSRLKDLCGFAEDISFPTTFSISGDDCKAPIIRMG